MRKTSYLIILSIITSFIICISPSISSINVSNSADKRISISNEDYELTIISGLNGLQITIICDPSIDDEFSWEFIDTVLPVTGSESNFTTDNGDGRIKIIVIYEWIVPVIKGDITIKVFRNGQLVKEVYGIVVIGIVDFIHPDISLSVDKGAYDEEETVKVIFNNNGREAYKLYDIYISIGSDDEDFDSYTEDIDEITIPAGDSKTALEWDQIDGKGNKAPTGRYSIYTEFYEDGVNYEQRNTEFSLPKVRSKFSFFYQLLKIFLARGGRFELPRS